MKRITFILLIILLVLSCAKIERIEDFPEHKNQLVVNCIFNPDTPFIFNLSKSLSPLDNAPFRDFTSPNGLVVVYENDAFFDSIRYNEMQRSFHGANNKKPKTGKTYRFEAFYPGYEKVSATGIIPEKFELSEYTLNERKIVISYDRIIRANISLIAVKPSSQYIIVGVNAFDTAQNTTWGVVHPEFTPFIQESTPGNISETIGGFLFIRNDGQPLQNLNIESEIYTYYEEEVFNLFNLKYTFTIFTCSKEVFEYKRRAALQYANQYDPFAEPTPIYNNIVNGYGIFGGENYSSYTITK
jgi:hypothetical protein